MKVSSYFQLFSVFFSKEFVQYIQTLSSFDMSAVPEFSVASVDGLAAVDYAAVVIVAGNIPREEKLFFSW